MAHSSKTLAASAIAVLAVLAAPLSLRADGVDSNQKALEKAHEQMLQVVNDLNKSNPFAQQSGLPQTVQPMPAMQLPPEMAQKLEFAKKYLENPYVQKYMRTLQDPAIQRDVLALVNHPRRVAALGWELGWILAMFLFKAWRLSKTKGIASMLFTQFWTFCLLLFGVSFLIPRLVIGESYVQLVRDLIQVMQR